MNPGVSLACTGRCPQRCASAASAAPTQGAVSRPSTTSTTFISGTGLKKWNPPMRCGCLDPAAIAVIDSDEVLDATRQSAASRASSALTSSRLALRSSTMASITTWQGERSARSRATCRPASARAAAARSRRRCSEHIAEGPPGPSSAVGGRMQTVARKLALLGLRVALPAAAQEFRSRPIPLVCPWPAGGSTDTHLRRFAEIAARHLGQTVVLENKPGAGGTIGVGTVAQNAQPDGYPLSQGPIRPFRIAHMQKLAPDPLRDLT